MSPDLFTPAPLAQAAPATPFPNQLDSNVGGVAHPNEALQPAPAPAEIDQPSNTVAPDQIAEPSENSEVASDQTRDSAFGFYPGQNPELGGSYAHSYDRARTLITDDPELRSAAKMAERAGDKDFEERLATIIADLDHDPDTALDAIRNEIFRSESQSRQSDAGSAMIAGMANRQAIDRLAALRPDIAIADARERGFRAAVNTSDEERRLLHIITSNPNLSFSEKLDRLDEAGFVDQALAGGLFSGFGLGTRGTPRESGGKGAKGSGPGSPEQASSESESIRSAKRIETEAVLRQRLDSPRKKPGNASGHGIEIPGKLLSDAMEGEVPKQVADSLKGRRFSSFDEYRRAFWKTFVGFPELAKQFSSQDRALMREGNAPKAPPDHQVGKMDTFQLDHKTRIADGGAVYDADNIRIVSPKRHHEIRYGPRSR
ncbi:MAG TPA: HNH endonuclease signature motif containing protein [Xanthobacteraceae bacterium]|nr:HNH endonuclease signature motif containing protein [Xanthobacteraceae bacterium]